MKPESSILITRTINPDSLLREWAESEGIQITGQAFIQFEAIKGLSIPKTDWIFFSSPAALELYLTNNELFAEKIAVYGDGTNQYLSNFGLTADFIGDATKNSSAIGKDFFQFIGIASVLFPVSQRSLKKISTQGNKEQVIELVTYHTTLVTKELKKDFEILIFTSPSNVDGYLIANKIPQNSVVIAFGQSTAKHLRKKLKREDIKVPVSPSESDLIVLLKQLN